MPMNLGNPDEYTIEQFAFKIRDLVGTFVFHVASCAANNARAGSSAPVVYKDPVIDDPKQRRPDITLAKTWLNWTPHVRVVLLIDGRTHADVFLGDTERRSEQNSGILSQRTTSEAAQRTQPVLSHGMAARIGHQENPRERTQRTVTLETTNFSYSESCFVILILSFELTSRGRISQSLSLFQMICTAFNGSCRYFSYRILFCPASTTISSWCCISSPFS